jgi:hypothetical protein
LVRGWISSLATRVDLARNLVGSLLMPAELCEDNRPDVFVSKRCHRSARRERRKHRGQWRIWPDCGNPPLGPERGGAYTTRSTHPVTIGRFNGILGQLGLAIHVENPRAWRTKGELVTAALAMTPADLSAGAALTMSCAKLNGNFYPGGDPNGQCGLCVACVTRRGSLIAAGIPDRTEYLLNRLVGESAQHCSATARMTSRQSF